MQEISFSNENAGQKVSMSYPIKDDPQVGFAAVSHGRSGEALSPAEKKLMEQIAEHFSRSTRRR